MQTKPGHLLEKIDRFYGRKPGYKTKGSPFNSIICHCIIKRECHWATVRNQSGKGSTFLFLFLFFLVLWVLLKKQKKVMSVLVNYLGLEERKKAGIHLPQPIYVSFSNLMEK